MLLILDKTETTLERSDFSLLDLVYSSTLRTFVNAINHNIELLVWVRHQLCKPSLHIL